MMARFDLSLSHDRIELTHGDTVIGAFDPSADGIEQKLADLKSAAQTFVDGDIFCRLILPNEHIRYLHLEDLSQAPDEIRAIALQALEAATPYAANELAIDIQMDSGVVWVAGVALQTLAEAEHFALAHGFKPVSFSALPEAGCFPRDPFFGESEHASGFSEPVPAEALTTAHGTEGVDVTQSDAPQRPDLTSRRRVPTFSTTRGENIEPAPTERRQSTSAPSRPSPTAVRITRPSPSAQPVNGHAAHRHGGRRKLAFAGTTVCVLGAAAVASAFAGPKVANFFALLTSPTPTAQFTAPQQPFVPQRAKEQTAVDSTVVEQVALRSDLSDEDAAVLDALRTPMLKDPTPRPNRTEDELRAAYAVTGIWAVSPEVPLPPGLTDLEKIEFINSTPVAIEDAVALPGVTGYLNDKVFFAPASPAPAGTTFALDDKGLVLPTPDGAMNPDGVMVFAGTPPLSPPDKLLIETETRETAPEGPDLIAFRPALRPAVSEETPTIESGPAAQQPETTEAQEFGLVAGPKLAQLRPQLRPLSEQDAIDAAVASAASLVPLDDTGSEPLIEQAPVDAADLVTGLAASLRPSSRPSNYRSLLEQNNSAPTPAPVAAVRATPQNISPTIPTSASVSRQATDKNVLNLRRVNLIGVYGKPTSRRALVRLSNGRYRKVEVGDRIDGGRVLAIGDSELQYQKSGRAVVLTMPRG